MCVGALEGHKFLNLFGSGNKPNNVYTFGNNLYRYSRCDAEISPNKGNNKILGSFQSVLLKLNPEFLHSHDAINQIHVEVRSVDDGVIFNLTKAKRIWVLNQIVTTTPQIVIPRLTLITVVGTTQLVALAQYYK